MEGRGARPARPGEVQTVLGPLDPRALGVTLPHEHLVGVFGGVPTRDGSSHLEAPEPEALARVDPASLWWVNAHPYRNRDNLRLDDEELAVEELRAFKAESGGCLVELTTRGLDPDPEALRRISAASGVAVVAGTGWYTAATRSAGFADLDVSDLAEAMVRDIRDGIDGSGVRAGIIGELGIEGPGPRPGVARAAEIGRGDEKLLRAAAAAQRRTGAAITIHAPLSSTRGPGSAVIALGLLDLLESAGADLGRVVVGHLDRRSGDTLAALLAIADRGAYVEFDCWGTQGYVMPDVCYPSDEVRVMLSRGIIEAGLGGRLLWSHDVCEKRMLRRHGAGGYAHIPHTLVPILRREGIPEEAIHRVLVENPATLLALAPAAPAPPVR